MNLVRERLNAQGLSGHAVDGDCDAGRDIRASAQRAQGQHLEGQLRGDGQYCSAYAAGGGRDSQAGGDGPYFQDRRGLAGALRVGDLDAREGCWPWRSGGAHRRGQLRVNALDEEGDYLSGRNRERYWKRVASSADHGRLSGGLRKDDDRRRGAK